MGYCFAFGEGIAQFLSITDIFAISINDISVLYLILLSGLVTLVVGRAKIGAWTKAEALMKQEQREDKTEEWEKLGKIRKGVFSAGTFIGVTFIVTTALQYLLTGRMNYALSGMAVTLFVGGGTAALLNRLDIHGARFVFPMYLVLVVIMSVIWGMQKGDLDRYKSFGVLAARAPSCNNFALIRPFSPFFLAVGRDNHHYMIDGDCKGKFRLKKVPIARPVIEF